MTDPISIPELDEIYARSKGEVGSPERILNAAITFLVELDRELSTKVNIAQARVELDRDVFLCLGYELPGLIARLMEICSDYHGPVAGEERGRLN